MATDNIIVAIKIRPLIKREKKANLSPVWSVQGRSIIQLDFNGQAYGEPYCFDHIFDANSTTEVLYGEVVKNYIKSAMQGFNLTIFAYGQTSSGKTYTMMGNENSSGIIQLTVNDIFQYVQEHTERKFLISCSYFEIYNEQIYDLLSMDHKTLKVREDTAGNISIQTVETVTSTPEAVMDVMNIGNKSRKMGSTKMNQRSSRSHTIFKISITSSEDKDDVKCSHLYLVDLAGSERVSQTKAEGERLKEGVNINKSLSALGNVIRQLSEQDAFVNYRDSKLTRILQPALGGNSKSLLITTITTVTVEETKSSLEFSQRAKIVKNKPVINQVRSAEDTRIKEVCDKYQKRVTILEEKAKQLEVERDKALNELLILKDGLTQLTEFERIGKSDITEQKSRRYTVGSYEPSKEIVTLRLTNPKSLRRSGEILTREAKVDTNLASSQTKLSPIVEETSSSVMKACSVRSPYSFLQTSITEQTLNQSVSESASALWREKHKQLEDSYEQLREYTNLEKEFTEEHGGFVHNIIEEKDRLYDDFLSIQALLMDERKKCQEENNEHQKALDDLKESNNQLKREIQELKLLKETAEYKYDELKTSTDKRIEDMENTLENCKKAFEYELCYYRDVVKKVNQEKGTLAKSLREEEHEKRMTEMQLIELSEKISEIDSDEKIDKVLSKLFELQDILMDSNKQFQGVMTQTEDIKERLELEIITEQMKDMEKEREQLQKSKQKLDKKCVDLEKEMSILKKVNLEKEQIKIELDKLSFEKNNILKEMEIVKKHNETLVHQLDTAEKERLQTIDENIIVVSDCREWRNRYNLLLAEQKNSDELSQTLEKLKIENTDLLMKLEDISTRNEELKQNSNIVKYEFDNKLEVIKQLMIECDDLNFKMKDLPNILEKLQKNENEKKKYMDEVEHLNRAEKELKKKIEHHNEQKLKIVQEMKEIVEEMEIVKNKLKMQDEKVIELEGMLNVHMNRATALNDKYVKEKNELIVENESLYKDNEKINEMLQLIGYDREKVYENVKMLITDINIQKEENKKLTKEKDDLNAQIKHLKEKNLTAATQLKNHNNSLQQINVTLQREVKETLGEIKILKDEIKEKDEKITKICNEGTLKMTKLTVEFMKTKQELEHSKKEINTYMDSIKELTDQNLKSKDENSKLENELKEITVKMKHFEEEIREKDNKIINMQLENNEQSEELRKCRANFREQSKRLIKLQSQLNEQRGKMQQRPESDQDRKKKVHTLYDSRRSLSPSHEITVAEKNKQLEIPTEELNKLRRLVKEKENELEENKKKIARLEKMTEMTYTENVDLQTKVYDMINKNDADKVIYESRVMTLENQIKQLKTSRKGQEVSLQTDVKISDLLNMDKKYELTKRVANMRKEEILKLRKQLGLQADTETD